ncbi:FtsX-like permease family protein [Salinibacterium sp. dk2585]|uniref:ABC transporter permease n=1 Tax=unclassified Salinibacterium TaxID=2632331 RepID=UPI0011C256C4|nr:MULTISPECIES: FtsX-like permease family protein [unclassified Salinibacterium]QEE61394.1 FtsX-like permease family protein [Salinibacterium sp. dk2585]TXK54071.1 FtsX-like permease family protein [Salinibacterium sp. dk5596]
MRGPRRDTIASIVVTSLSAAFGAALIQATSILATVISADDISSRSTAQLALVLVAGVFIVIAVYVGSIVTTNTFATIIAGRTRTIALMRLLGSSASAQRRAVAKEGLIVGLMGSAIGAALGVVLTAGGIRIAAASGAVPDLDYVLVDPLVLLPVVMVIVSTWAASWLGSRGVLQVSPMQATGAAIEPSREESVRRPVRNAFAAVLFFGGLAVLGAGIAIGLVSPLGFLVAFLGGIASFSGIVLGAHLVLPPLLRLSGRMLGGSAAARLAAENGMRYPGRSARTTIGLVIGVTLITTFAVAAQGYLDMIEYSQQQSPDSYGGGVDELLLVTVGIFSALIGFSAVTAAFGMVNTLSLSVLQRSRELGLLRALGFTARQVRSMIIAESLQLTVTGVGFGVVLGVVYGWAGAQSLLGSIEGSPGLVWPSVPWMLVVVVVAGAALVTLVTAQLPARRATRVSPVAALTVD